MGVVLESESSESEGDLPKKVEKEEEEDDEVRRVSETPRVGSFVFLFSLFFVKHKRRFDDDDDDDDEMGISLSLSLSLSPFVHFCIQTRNNRKADDF